MSAFHYIVASLPFLISHHQAPPMKSSDLLELCERFLSHQEYKDFVSGNLSPEGSSSNGIFSEYRLWERSLRNDLVQLRSTRLKQDTDTWQREADVVFGTRSIAVEAMAKSTPLDAEIFLSSQRWLKIEELVCGHYFNMEFLCGFRLKLLLLERRSLFDKEKSIVMYRDIYKRVFETSGETQG